MIPNVFKLFKDFQRFQGEMKKIQEELAKEEVVGSSGAGMVEVTLNGKLEAVDVKIEKTLLRSKDGQMLQALIVAAINDAIKKAQEKMNEKMGEVMGELNLSGLNIPGLPNGT
ncbi:YbaB/EbfC family nucleoid-associated protein [Candidatus Aerophobetes bacterium]|nr:YbaB/EbfC family nucleoid-associated protein [Candidatus Aerophobetes bacterium]